jgi:protein TonB
MFPFRRLVFPVLLLGASATLHAQTAPTAAHLKDAACGKPTYPSALSDQEQGTVVIAFLVSKEGAVLDAKLARSSGYRDLDRAALATYSRCPFVPATVGGEPQQSWAMLSHTFAPERPAGR